MIISTRFDRVFRVFQKENRNNDDDEALISLHRVFVNIDVFNCTRVKTYDF